MKPRPITVEEALSFAEEHASIESTDDEVENVLAAEVRRLRVENKALEAAVTQNARATRSMEKRVVERWTSLLDKEIAALREDNQHLSDQAENDKELIESLRQRHAEAEEQAFKAGYHCQWIRDEQRYIFDPDMKPGDPDGAYFAWLAPRKPRGGGWKP